MYEHCNRDKREEAGRRRKRGKRRSESETRTSSGPVSSESLERASGILSVTRPSLGRLNLARQEKLQVTTPQASLTEKKITSTLFICLSVFKSSSLSGNAVKREASLGQQTKEEFRIIEYKCYLVLKGIV